MDNKAENNLYHLNNTCPFCHLRDICLFNVSDMRNSQHEKIIQRPNPLQKKQHLFRQGEQFNNLYVVKSGCLKNYFYGFDGKEQIIDFIQPGEIIGLDSMDKNNYVSSAVALETTSVCKLPFKHFRSLCQKNPFIYNQFFHLACKKITSSYNLLHLLRDCPAEVKLASFLLNYSSRKEKYGYSRLEFSLSMPRYDIANYLGLAIETISRVLSNFDNEGILKVNGRSIIIIDIDKLMLIAKMTYPDLASELDIFQEGKNIIQSRKMSKTFNLVNAQA